MVSIKIISVFMKSIMVDKDGIARHRILDSTAIIRAQIFYLAIIVANQLIIFISPQLQLVSQSKSQRLIPDCHSIFRNRTIRVDDVIISFRVILAATPDNQAVLFTLFRIIDQLHRHIAPASGQIGRVRKPEVRGHACALLACDVKVALRILRHAQILGIGMNLERIAIFRDVKGGGHHGLMPVSDGL